MTQIAPSTALLGREMCVFIDGAWRAGHGDQIVSVDPSTGQRIAEFQGARPEDVAVAAEAATRAFGTWRRLPSTQRAAFLRGFAEGLRRRKDDLVQLQMLNNGKPRIEAEIDVDDAAATFDYYADLAETLDARQDGAVELPDSTLRGRTRFEPVGPVALIVPWNFPMVTTAWKLAPALAVGCTAVLKPSEFTTPAELVYGDIALEIGLPAGVLNILPGAGAVGGAMTAEPRFRKISFTGSNATGRRVMAAAAERSVPVSLELGGKSPIVILDDADVAQAVEIAALGIFFNAGQMCSATSRMILSDRIADDVIAGLRRHVAGMVVAGHQDPRAEMGPLTTAAQRDKVLEYLLRARHDGLDCLTGGASTGPQSGFFVEPTVYLDVPTDHAIWREEIFGPVLAIRRVSSDDEALALANENDFGLAATVVGGARAEDMANHIDAGHVWVNSPQIIFPNTAWGGFKASGIGRELGPWGLAAYSGVKHVTSRA
ncbi:aldehyde dehydrogenase family protein [Paracoccus litorisediminis]|nr:aldehyde dehydrogenase family protein [Paracoccus litorisediminis]